MAIILQDLVYTLNMLHTLKLSDVIMSNVFQWKYVSWKEKSNIILYTKTNDRIYKLK